MIGKNAEALIQRAIHYAIERKHELLTIEHIFLSLLDDEKVAQVLEECGAEISVLRESLDYHLNREVPQVPAAEDSEQELPRGPLATPAGERIIQRAIIQV